jgi:hypothetical protein
MSVNNYLSKPTKMKSQLLFSLLSMVVFSCTDQSTGTGKEGSELEEVASETSASVNGVTDYTGNKKSFMLTCNIDGRLALGGDNATDAQVSQFCECAWEKTGGKYEDRVMANNSALENHPVLKGCFEKAKGE